MRFTLLAFAVVALALLALVEIGLAYPVAWYLYVPVALAFAAGLIRPVPVRRQLPQMAALLMMVGVITALYLIEWSTRKPFLRDLGRVRVGMPEAEARQIMRRYMEGTGWPVPAWDQGQRDSAPETPHEVSGGSAPASASPELVLPDAMVFRHSNDGAFNSDWGIISVSNGKVVRVEFSAD